jgi:hypothetical protein
VLLGTVAQQCLEQPDGKRSPLCKVGSDAILERLVEELYLGSSGWMVDRFSVGVEWRNYLD